MLIKRTKQLIGISILIICLLLFLIIGLLTKNVENEPEISPEKSYDITLKYIAQGNPRQTEEIPLTTSEQESLNNILDNMRFSDSAKSATNQKYIINYCDNELSLGENNIVSKNNKTVSISDVYEMQQFYKIDIANECLVKQLYGLTTEDNSIFGSMPVYKSTIPFMEDNINGLKGSTDYIEKIIKNNSSYNFTSRSTKDNIYDQLKDSYYSILYDYVNVVDFMYDTSVLYKNMAGGNIWKKHFYYVY